MKKSTIKAMVSGSIKKAAVVSAGTASFQGFHQPKEPATLKQLKK